MARGIYRVIEAVYGFILRKNIHMYFLVFYKLVSVTATYIPTYKHAAMLCM